MGYDRGDSFPFNFEPNGFPFGSKSKRKLSPQPYPIRFERKWKYSFLSVAQYLQSVFSLGGADLLKEVLSLATFDGKVRVTKCMQIVEKLVDG